MRKMLSRFVVAALALSSAALSVSARAPADAAAADSRPLRLRVLSYNIHHGEGVDRKLDLPRIARVIADQKPDLVALQEMDVKTQRTGGVDQPAELARLTGMHVAFGKGIDYQGGEYGNAILSRFPIESKSVHPLPASEGEERRNATVVTVRPWEGGPEVRFVGTHLNYRDESERVLEVKAILSALKQGQGGSLPTILAGDLNARPGTAPLKLFAPDWKDAAADRGAGDTPEAMTYPAEKPVRRIDYVLLHPAAAWRVVESKVVPEPVASDHRPVLAVVELLAGQAAPQAAPTAPAAAPQPQR